MLKCCQKIHGLSLGSGDIRVGVDRLHRMKRIQTREHMSKIK
jgi:hypothetical protein